MINHLPERRRYPRLEKNIPLKLRSEEFDIVTETRNLSCVGVYCHVDKYLEPMTKLEVHLLIPLRKGNTTTIKKVSCHGVVVRVESQPGNAHFNIAIFFNEVDKRDIKVIAEYVNAALRKS